MYYQVKFGVFPLLEDKYRKSSNKPLGAYLQKYVFVWGLIRGGGLFQSLAFSSNVDIKNDIIFSIN